MATIISSPTNPQVEGITRNTLFKRLLRETGLGAYGTATSGSVTLIGDTNRLKSTQYNSKDWVGGWARISKDAGGAAAAPEGEISPITTYAPTHATDHITVNPAITAVAASDEYELWRNPNPQLVIDMLDELLQEEIYIPCWTMLTGEVADGDMEQDNTTDWTASNTTLTKQTGEPALFGKRYLRVVTTTALGYARSALLRVEPGKSYHLSAAARVSAASTTARLIAYDETNGASIDSADSIRLYPVRIGFEFTAPSGCYTVSARLANVENTVTTEWDEVVMYPLEAQDIRLPWWVKDKGQILGVFRASLTSIATDLYDWIPRGERDRAWDIRDNAPGGRGLKLVARYGNMSSGPLFIYGIRNETAYSNDNSDEKAVDSNLLMAHLAYKVFQHLAQRPISGFFNMEWVQAQEAKWLKIKTNLQYNYMERISQVITSPSPDIGIMDSRFDIRAYR